MEKNIPDESFEQYLVNARNKFVGVVTETFPHERIYPTETEAIRARKIRVASEDVLIAYDQASKALSDAKDRIGILMDEISHAHIKLADANKEIERLKGFLIEHEKWEAAVISDDSMWWPKRERDALNGKIYESFLELQSLRNKFLGKYQEGKCNHSYRYYQDKRVCHSCGHTVYGDFR